MSDIRIRLATGSDAEALLGIYRHYVLNTAITFEIDPPTVEEFRARIERTLARYPWLVVEEDGVPVGYAYAGPLKPRAAYDRSVEVSIYVHHAARRRGIGRRLYEHLESILTRQGITNLYACITCTDRTDDPYLSDASIRFHEKMGYVRAGLFNDCGFKFGRWYSACWMEKAIAEHTGEPGRLIPFLLLTE